MSAQVRVQARTPAAEATAVRLRVTEIFLSIQGESTRIGLPTVFVRLTGCPLRCRYCDTAYAFTGGSSQSLAEVLEQVGSHRTRFVTVTGGEPLAQPGARALLAALCERGYAVSLETGGALDVAGVDRRVMKVLDIKTPGSGEVGRNRWDNLQHLAAGDQLKFVICDRGDYEWARRQVLERDLVARCEVLFSPAAGVAGAPPARELAEWILADRLAVRLQVQLHKLLWGDVPGR